MPSRNSPYVALVANFRLYRKRGVQASVPHTCSVLFVELSSFVTNNEIGKKFFISQNGIFILISGQALREILHILSGLCQVATLDLSTALKGLLDITKVGDKSKLVVLIEGSAV